LIASSKVVMYIEKVESVSAELLAACERLMPQLTNAPMPTRADLGALLASPSILIVARPSATGPIIGMATLGIFRTPSGQHAHVEDVIVAEEMRGQGIGEALVKRLLEVADEMGFEGVSLTCNPRRVAANALYCKMGFKEWQTNVYWYELDDRQ
jgi:ribosomal protein S18 acetylase RimI-like enzyme